MFLVMVIFSQVEVLSIALVSQVVFGYLKSEIQHFHVRLPPIHRLVAGFFVF